AGRRVSGERSDDRDDDLREEKELHEREGSDRDVSGAAASETKRHAQDARDDGHDDLRDREPQNHRSSPCRSGMFIVLFIVSPRRSTTPMSSPSGSTAARWPSNGSGTATR